MGSILEKPGKANRDATSTRVGGLVTISSLVGTVLVLGWVLWCTNYGIEFTDEGFYLAWMANPFNYSVSATQFGFVYHPLYKILSGNISLLRQANVVITFGLAWCLGFIFIHASFGERGPSGMARYAVSAALAVASLLFLRIWLPTPSYNSLALQSLLICAIGLILADKSDSPASKLGWVLIGIGGWLAFMSKPTTAGALGIVSALYLLLAGKLNGWLAGLAAGVAAGLVVISALLIDGSVFAFVERLKFGVEYAQMLGGGHTLSHLLRLDDLPLTFAGKRSIAFGTLAFLACALALRARAKVLAFVGAILLSSLLLTPIVIIVSGLPRRLDGAANFPGLLIWAVPLAAVLAGMISSRARCLTRMSRSQWALVLCFLAIPHIYAFGTNGNYWSAGAGAGIFWVLAALVPLSTQVSGVRLDRMLLPLGLAAQLIAVVSLAAAMEAPYRQPQPLRENQYRIDFGQPGSTLVLSSGYGGYVADATALARRAGFGPGTPVIDLTGQSPGLLYALGASNIGQAWTIGGYPGSEHLAATMLRRVSCDVLAEAWVLIETEGQRKLSPEVLTGFGASLQSDYDDVGTLNTPGGAGGYAEVRLQRLLKPIRSPADARAACNRSRVGQK